MWSSAKFILPRIYKRKRLYVGILIMVIECLTPVLAMKYQSNLIDSILIQNQIENFIPLLLLFLICFFAPRLFVTIRKIAFHELSYELQESLMREYLTKVYRLPSNIFNKVTGSKLLHHLKSDISSCSDTFINQILSEYLFSILSIVFLGTAMIIINMYITICIVGIAILYFAILQKFTQKTRVLAQSVQSQRVNLSANMQENISSVRDTIAFNRSDFRLEDFKNHYSNYYNALFNQSMHTIKTIIVTEPLLYVTKLLMILFGFLLVTFKQLSIGSYVVSYILAEQLVTVIGQLFHIGLAHKKLEPHVNALKNILSQNEDQYGNVELQDPITSISFNNVTYGYSAEQGTSTYNVIFETYSLSMPTGCKIALIGASGCGKSTLARLLIRQLKPQSGEVFINGININEYSHSYKDKVMLVPQDPLLLPLSIKDNLTLGMNFTLSELKQACEAMLCYDFIMRLPEGFDTLIGERGANLSGGEKQRLALARALLKNPEVLILDEATSAMDFETEYAILKKLDSIRDKMTTIIIAHRNTSIRECDKIFEITRNQQLLTL